MMNRRHCTIKLEATGLPQSGSNGRCRTRDPFPPPFCKSLGKEDVYMIQLLLSDVLPTRRTLVATVDGMQNHHLAEAFAVRGWAQGLNIALLN